MIEGHLVFIVEGSQGDEYEVKFKQIGNNLIVTCTCQAADNGLHCKHRIALLNGDIGSVTSGNERDLAKTRALLSGTSLEAALIRYQVAEDACERAKSELAKAKKALARAMINQMG